jgi:hypothetical protein
MRGRILLMLASVLVVIAGAVAYMSRYGSAESTDELLGRGIKPTKLAIKRQIPHKPSPPYTKQEEDAAWKSIVKKMDADSSEVEGVLKSARQELKSPKRFGGNTLNIPVYARKGYVGGEEYWIIGCGWGVTGNQRGECFEYPGHDIVLLISAKPPYKVVEDISCS